MCGISGCIVRDNSAMVAVVGALNKLQNRGYDSAGICTIINNGLVIKKNISKPGENAVQNINSDPLATISTNIAVGHTRWATHGAKTIENAHPHHNDDMRFAMVHNGIIENYSELREELVENGYTFYGQTDTEVVVKYLDLLYKRGGSIANLDKYLKGSWAILVLDRLESNKIFFMKNGSPLILGFNNQKTKVMFVSELIGFDTDIQNYFVIADNEYGYVDMNECCCEIKSTKSYDSIPMTNLAAESTPAPYKHWTLKEINDQPNAISALLSNRIKYNVNFDDTETELVFPELDNIKEKLVEIDHIIFLACGTSYHAAQVGVKFFKEFRSNVTIEVIDGADFEETDMPPNKKILLVLLSQSGETKDLYRALQIGKEHGITSIGIINVENSLIAREVDCCLYLKAGREHAVASTKSFTNQVIMLLLFSIWMTKDINKEIKAKYLSSLERLSVEFYEIIKKSTNEIPKILNYFKNQHNCFILGKHSGEWIAKEGSLKIKEISYIHSEGFSAAALKHGPFALLSHNIPIILLANNDRFYSKIENVTAEVKSRCANVVCITNKQVHSDNIDYLFHFDTNSVLFPLLSIVPLQMLAYYLALERGNHPDYPRNLAKVVTVE
ncbi:glucosamine-fructose-6-phosphate aminotransferase [Tupanvirus deep ocean]|uniref:Glucosamine-fructose-6-phosphate aminotransferase n=2 Tax=Tupanvirus TaxID=2094720 RepID=A0AC62A6R8_9VIRU|nr:glucosamine-fructose-6-phosphate aminotransferase [Tupanvirus deep ocean]QKU33475.1 glucosamine-fructose-6-phosphate aminotransferase [Tupanvirus deep ocean]